MRDKLIELIDDNKACPFDDLACCECEYSDITPCFAGRMADVLIANGVTFADVPDNNVGDKKPMTNADRIRAMSDEELADWFILRESMRKMDRDMRVYGTHLPESIMRKFAEHTRIAWLNWLKQPAEVDHDN